MRRRSNVGYMSRYTDARQQRKESAKRRVPTHPEAVRLRKIELAPVQARAVSATQVRTWHDKDATTRSAGRFSLLVSIGLHGVIALVIGVVLVSQVVELNESAVVTDIYRVNSAPPPKRRIPPRITRAATAEVPSPVKRFSLPQSGVTVAQFSTADMAYALPAANALTADSLTGIGSGFGRGLLVAERQAVRGIGRASSVTAVPPPSPPRSISTDVVAQIGSIEPEAAPPSVIESPAVVLSDVTRKPSFLRKITPKYPDPARRVEREGVVWLEAAIGVDGTAREIRVIEGIGYGCDEAAIEALRASRFIPAKRGDEQVSVRIQIPYRFVLEA